MMNLLGAACLSWVLLANGQAINMQNATRVEVQRVYSQVLGTYTYQVRATMLPDQAKVLLQVFQTRDEAQAYINELGQ